MCAWICARWIALTTCRMSSVPRSSPHPSGSERKIASGARSAPRCVKTWTGAPSRWCRLTNPNAGPEYVGVVGARERAPQQWMGNRSTASLVSLVSPPKSGPRRTLNRAPRAGIISSCNAPRVGLSDTLRTLPPSRLIPEISPLRLQRAQREPRSKDPAPDPGWKWSA